MSMKYLGETFDIHGGGLDNQFPHHECEVAQSECATGKPFVRYWIHNNLVTVNGQKMSKSLGNFVTLKDAFKKFDPLVVRFFILQSHYRSTLDFSDEAMQGAKAGLEKLMNFVRELRSRLARPGESPAAPRPDFAPYRTELEEAMDDDFNTPKAIAVLFKLASDVNGRYFSGTPLDGASLKELNDLVTEFGGGVLGIIPSDIAGGEMDQKLTGGLLDLLIGLRSEVRKQKLFSLSDLIRDRLKALGIAIEDKKDGTTWRKL